MQFNKVSSKVGYLLSLALTLLIASCVPLNHNSHPITIGISSENLILKEPIVSLLEKATGSRPQIIAKGSVSLTKLACAGQLDAMAIADDMWAEVLCPDASWTNDSGTLYGSKIQFALPTETAKKLGWHERLVSRAEVLEALQSGTVKLASTLPTHSNSGYNTLLWLTRETIGNSIAPEQITAKSLESLQPIYQNLALSSESTSYLAEKLTRNWQPDTLAALYSFLYAPDGSGLYLHNQKISVPRSLTLIDVSPTIVVTPTWFVTTRDTQLKQKLIVEVFEQLKAENPQIFSRIKQLNPPVLEAKVETTPVAAVHRTLLENFHPAIRQKRWLVGIIDGSGSMKGQGFSQLLSAFGELLPAERARANFLYSPEDKFSLVVYQGSSAYQLEGGDRERLWQALERVSVKGGTPVKAGLIEGIKAAQNIPPSYSMEMFLFTDGQFNNPLDTQLLNGRTPRYV